MKKPEVYKPGQVVCLVRVGKRWLVGWNDQQKTSPAYSKRMPDGEIKRTRHAEEHALQLARRIGGKIKEVVVLRWTKNGELSMAKPCVSCQKKLWDAGVKMRSIRYSNHEGKMKTMS